MVGNRFSHGFSALSLSACEVEYCRWRLVPSDRSEKLAVKAQSFFGACARPFRKYDGETK